MFCGSGSLGMRRARRYITASPIFSPLQVLSPAKYQARIKGRGYATCGLQVITPARASRKLAAICGKDSTSLESLLQPAGRFQPK